MEIKTWGEKILKMAIFVGLLALIVLIFSQKIELTAVDLGRHLANGRVAWQDTGVLFKNFYSYTEPDLRFINHHWLGGVILYAIYQLSGFVALSIFNIILAWLVFSLVFDWVKRQIGFYPAALSSLPIIFLLSERVEIRPEIFSYLFIFILWRLIEWISNGKRYRHLLWLGPLFIIWANTHIYFFIGLALLGFKAWAEFFPRLFSNWRQPKLGLAAGWLVSKVWVYALIYASLACLINPNTWRGLVYPFRILVNYGYEIAENKSIFFMEDLILNPNFLLWKMVAVVLVISGVILLARRKVGNLFNFFLSIFFIAFGLMAVRNISLSALAAWLIISFNLKHLIPSWPESSAFAKLDFRGRALGPILILLIVVSSFIYLWRDGRVGHRFIKHDSGWGLAAGNDESAEFFRNNKLSGPIFNNYDIGSALIFWLYPQEKVFVDNRPEAYSSAFFRDVYKPIQSDPKKWREYSAQHKLKTIYFSYGDSTPWAQDFLSFILADESWALVHFDYYSVILLNKDIYSAEEINKLSIDTWSFRKRWRDLASRAGLADSFRLASLAQLAGQPDLAEEAYRQILFDYPDNVAVLVSFGYLYSGYQDKAYLRKSLEYLRQASDAGYLLPSLYVTSGLVHWRLGEYQKAETAWRSALELDKDDESARQYLNQMEELRRSGRLP